MRRSLSFKATRSFAAQRATAPRSFAPSNRSTRHSTQSAHNVENSAAFSRMDASVYSTMGTMTLGRPSPMRQPRTEMQDMAALLIYRYRKWIMYHNHDTLCQPACQASETGFARRSCYAAAALFNLAVCCRFRYTQKTFKNLSKSVDREAGVWYYTWAPSAETKNDF